MSAAPSAFGLIVIGSEILDGRRKDAHFEVCRRLLEERYIPLKYCLVVPDDPVLLEKPSVLALTKCDLLEGGIAGVDPTLLKIHLKVYPISSITREGIEPLLLGLVGQLD